MTSATIDDSDTIVVDFLTSAGLTNLTVAHFQSKPNNDGATSIAVLGPKQLEVNFGVDISAETGIELTTAVPGFVSPQVQAIT